MLKPDGWVVLIWNERRIDSTPFLRTYEQALVRYSIDYQEVRHENAQATVEDFFAPEKCHAASFANFQYFDLDGFLGRVNSSSYTPPPEHPNYQPLMDALQSIFKAHAKNGKVVFEYDTRVYYGHLPPRL